MSGDYLYSPQPSRAARDALDALSGEFREEVLRVAGRRAAVFREGAELSVGDVVRAADDVLEGKAGRARRYDGLIKAYLGFGASVAAASTIVLLVLTVGSPSNIPQLLTAVFGIAGALVAGLGAAMSASRARREEWERIPREALVAEAPEPDFWLLSRWLALEVAVRDAVAERLGESQANAPLSVLIRRLVESGILVDDDLETFRRVLSLRNQVAHGHGRRSWESTEAALKDLDELLRKLRRDRVSAERELY